MSTRVDAPSPPASPNVPVQRQRAMHQRPYKKRDWDAELAALGVPSDSPMRRIQRHLQDNSEDKENFIGVDDASAREGTAMEATVGPARDDGTSTPDQAKSKGIARRGWSPAIPFDLGADRSPFLTDVAESPVGDDASPVPELARWKPGATPRAIGGMLGGVYGRDEPPSLDAAVPGDAIRGRESAPNAWPPESQPVAFLGSNTDPLAMAWLAKLTRAGFHVAACVGTHAGSDDDGMSTGECVPGRGCQPASHARHATELVLGSQSIASPKVWAPGLRAKSARDTCVRGEGPPAPRPLLLARFTHESAFSHAMDKVLCGGDEADRRLMGGRLIVINATPMSPAASQRIGDKLASIGVAYVQIALAGGARECELGDTHAFVAYTDGKVPAHIGKQCGTTAGFGVKGPIDEISNALGVIAQEPPTIVSHTEASACANLRLVETVRTVAMRARVSNEFRIGAKLARSESERSKLLAKFDELNRDANEAKRDSKLAREDAAASSKRLVDAERHNSDLNRRLREATTELELERRAAADADAERINLRRELRAAEDAVARSIPASDECDLNSTKNENITLRESVEELRGTVQAVRASTAAKIAAVVQAKAELEKQLVSVQSIADAAERSEREAVSANETLRTDVNRLDADLTATRTELEGTTRTLIDERRRADAAEQSLDAFKIASENEAAALQAALSAQSTRFQTASGELARARAEIELLVDETHVLRDELAAVNGKSEAAVAKAAEETEAANALTAEAESRLEAKEKELWCLQRQLERRGREANTAAKAASERIATLTDEKASISAESIGAKAAIRRCNRVKEETVRKLRDELDETKKALLHATSRRVGRPWAEDNAVNASEKRTQKTENSTAEELETKKRLEERLEKERSRREQAEASVASLQSALTTTRKQSHAETEKAVNELIESRDAVARAEAERTSIQAQLRGRVEVAAEYATRARADAGTKARLKAQCERANRELTREKDALSRIAKRLGEMQGAQGEASSIRQLAEAEAESSKAKYTELALKVSGAQKATADATLLASTATAELELAVRAKDAAVEESARLRSRVDTYEQTVSELREEIRGFSTADVAQELKTAMAKQSEAHESALCELRSKAAAAEAQARKATAALVKTEAWARAAEKALATEKANSPPRAMRASTQSVGMSGERSAVVGSNPASPASIVPLRTRDTNVVNGDEDAGAGPSPKKPKAKAASAENITPASSVENIPALLESHAPSPARPSTTSLTPNSVNPDTGCPHEVKQRIADRLGDVAYELEELSPSKASLETALGSLDMKPTLDALRLGKRIPRGCTALAAILAIAVTDPDAVDLTLTEESVVETLKCGETFGDESLCSYEVNAVYTQWLAIRAYLNHHAVTVGDHAVGALARRTRVEPMESRMRAAGSQNSLGSDCDLSFAVSTLKALIDGGLGEDDARSSGCVVCELLHTWSVTAVRSWQLCAAQERLDTELLEAEFGRRIPAETSGTEEVGDKEEKDEVERAFAKVVAVKKVRTMKVKKAAAKPPRQPSRVRDFVF